VTRIALALVIAGCGARAVPDPAPADSAAEPASLRVTVAATGELLDLLAFARAEVVRALGGESWIAVVDAEPGSTLVTLIVSGDADAASYLCTIEATVSGQRRGVDTSLGGTSRGPPDAVLRGCVRDAIAEVVAELIPVLRRHAGPQATGPARP
jgi:hypothetical protein